MQKNMILVSFNLLIRKANIRFVPLEIGTDEFFMGVNLIRWWYLSKAKGKLLEIGRELYCSCKISNHFLIM
jgi:hypothetical protein